MVYLWALEHLYLRLSSLFPFWSKDDGGISFKVSQTGIVVISGSARVPAGFQAKTNKMQSSTCQIPLWVTYLRVGSSGMWNPNQDRIKPWCTCDAVITLMFCKGKCCYDQGFEEWFGWCCLQWPFGVNAYSWVICGCSFYFYVCSSVWYI